MDNAPHDSTTTATRIAVEDFEAAVLKAAERAAAQGAAEVRALEEAVDALRRNELFGPGPRRHERERRARRRRGAACSRAPLGLHWAGRGGCSHRKPSRTRSRVAERCVRDWAAVRAVGVGAPGGAKARSSGCSNLFRVRPVPRAARGARGGAPPRQAYCPLVNDADAAALAARWVGAARGFERAAVLTLGTGVGCGLFLGGDAPLRDVEAGHASVGGPDGRQCSVRRAGLRRPTPRRRPS